MGFAHRQANNDVLLVDIDTAASLNNGSHNHVSFLFKKGGRLSMKNLIRVLPKGVTIRGSFNLPGSDYYSGYDHQNIDDPLPFEERI